MGGGRGVERAWDFVEDVAKVFGAERQTWSSSMLGRSEASQNARAEGLRLSSCADDDGPVTRAGKTIQRPTRIFVTELLEAEGGDRPGIGFFGTGRISDFLRHLEQGISRRPARIQRFCTEVSSDRVSSEDLAEAAVLRRRQFSLNPRPRPASPCAICRFAPAPPAPTCPVAALVAGHDIGRARRTISGRGHDGYRVD